MFDFWFKKKTGEMQSLFDVITADTERMLVSKMAIEKAVGMIAKAIAKSEIVIQSDKGRRTDKYYYRLNVRPNDNETGTYFWENVVRKILLEGECLVCRIGEKYFRVEAYSENDYVLRSRTYTNITLESAGKTYRYGGAISADDMLHFRYNNSKIMQYLKTVVDNYDKTLSAVNQMIKMSNTPRFKLLFDAQVPLIVEKSIDPNVPDKKYTKDEYAQKIKNILAEDSLSILTMGKGVDFESLKLETSLKVEDMVKIRQEEMKCAAMAFDIPESAFAGTITEKSDATNEFITYAVSPIAEVLNDTFQAQLVGENGFISGERIFVWMAKFKHVDVIDSANGLDKLRGIGFCLDDVFDLINYPKLNTEFSQKRALTKNYLEEGESDIEDETDKKE